MKLRETIKSSVGSLTKGLRNSIAHSMNLTTITTDLGEWIKNGKFLLNGLGGGSSALKAAERSHAILLSAMRGAALCKAKGKTSYGDASCSQWNDELCLELLVPQPDAFAGGDLNKKEIKLHTESTQILIGRHRRGQLIGRENELRRLNEHVEGKEFSRTVIHGPSGVGKSSLAAGLAEQLHRTLPVQFWIPASNQSGLEAALAQALTVLEGRGPESSTSVLFTNAKAVLKNSPPLLLVIDDVTDPSLILRYIPENKHHLIVTSLLSNKETWWRVFAQGRLLNLRPLKTDDSMKMISNRLENSKKPRQWQRAILNDVEVRDWVENTLGNLPLAVELAASAMNTRKSFHEARERMSFSPSRSLGDFSDDLGLSLVNRGIADSVFLLVDKISKQSFAIMEILALLGGAVPWTALMDCFKQAPDTHGVQKLLKRVGGERYNRVSIQELEDLALVVVKHKSDIRETLVIHQLVQRAILDIACKTDNLQLRGTSQCLANCLLWVFSNSPSAGSTGVIQCDLRFSMLPLVENLFHFGCSLPPRTRSEIAICLGRASFTILSNSSESCRWYKQAIALLEGKEDSSEPSLLLLKAEHGALLWRNGEADRSIEVLLDVLHRTENANGRAASPSLECVDKRILCQELASAYILAGRPREGAGFLQLSLAAMATGRPLGMKLQHGREVEDTRGALTPSSGLPSPAISDRSSPQASCVDLFWLGVEVFNSKELEQGHFLMREAVSEMKAASSCLGEYMLPSSDYLAMCLLTSYSAVQVSRVECLLCGDMFSDAMTAHFVTLCTQEMGSFNGVRFHGNKQ